MTVVNPHIGPNNLVELLHQHVEATPDKVAFRFLIDGEPDGKIETWTYAELDRRARAVAARLQAMGMSGSRAMLVFAPGMNFVQAFLGCLYANVVAVPAYPPEPHRLQRTLPRFQAVVNSSGAQVALTSSMMLGATRSLAMFAPSLASLTWLGVDDVPDEEAKAWAAPELSGETIAFLQFTSGSTGDPKGVVIRHRQMLANEAMMQATAHSNTDTVLLNWVPFYHDLGLIGGVLHGLYVGGTSVLMSPMHFLQRPARWLRSIDAFKANISAAPNFAFDLCVRKIGPDARAGLDLSSWNMALCGAEPVRADTMRHFIEAFEPCGFRGAAIYPGYGMAECVLSTTGNDLLTAFETVRLEPHALQDHRVVPSDDPEQGVELVGNGPPLPGVIVAIVDPQTHLAKAPDEIGEIWLRGPHVASGYWEQPEASAATFEARLADDPEQHPWLRTGDLGFLVRGQVYVAGRIKDLIILDGRNHYPQDFELTAESSYPALRPGGSAAFSVAGDTPDAGERLVIVAEFDERKGVAQEATQAIRSCIAAMHEVEVSEVALVKPRSIAKTSSGKIQRRQCRAQFEAGELDELHRSDVVLPISVEPTPEPPGPGEGSESLTRWLAAIVATRIGIPANELDVQASFSTFGLDSKSTVELSGDVADALGQDVSPSAIYDHPSVAQLATHLHEGRRRALLEVAVERILLEVEGLDGAFDDDERVRLRHRMVATALGESSTQPGVETNGAAGALAFDHVPDLYEITGRLVEMTRTNLGGYCAIYLCDPSQNVAELSRYASVIPDEPSYAFAIHEGLTGAVFESGQVLRLAQLHDDERYRPDLEAPAGDEHQAAMWVPLFAPDNRVVGVLQACRCVDEPFTVLDEELARGLTEATRPVLTQALLEAQARRMRELEHQTWDLVQALSEESPLQVVLRRVLRACVDMFDVDRGSVFLYDEATDELFSLLFDQTTDSESGDGYKGEIRFAASAGIAGHVFTSAAPSFIRDPYQNPRFNREIDQKTGFVTRSIDAVPLLDNEGAPIGVLQLINRSTPTWTSSDRKHLMSVASQAARAITATPFFQTLRASQDAPPSGRTAGGSEAIAIVGMACRFPGGVASPEDYWRLLSEGFDAITEVPPSRWDVEAWFDPEPGVPGKMYTRWGGFLDDIDQFDATFFGISPREARTMDPQQRILLEVAWEALERAGVPADRLAGTRTGVYIGIANSDYGGRLLHAQHAEGLDAYAITGNAFSVVAGRLSYLLGLRGPSMPVDTACSSSLVSVHLAGRALQNGECDVALAGGVNALLTPGGTVCFSQLRAMAPDGRCKAFAATANGYVRSEGCGIVVLKRLADALAHGDTIHAVLRGSAVNHDGHSNGLTAPSGPAQREVIAAALADAGRLGSDVTFIEAHGTGTSLGDPIELSALGAAVGLGSGRSQPVWVSSVKTNIGHTEAAAGVAGLIKSVLALQHRELPKHLHFDEPTPHVAWDQLGLEVPTRSTPLAPEGPLLAGISSFGIGGTNAHLIVESAPAPRPVERATGPSAYLLPISARHPSSLHEVAGTLSARLRTVSDDAELRDLVYTAVQRRSHLPMRWAVVGDNAHDLVQALDSRLQLPDRPAQARRPDQPVFVYSGQGGQWPAMGNTLMRTSPPFRRAIEACARALAPHVSWSLTALLTGRADAELWQRDDVIQPALFSVQVALTAVWRHMGVEPAVVVGHSMGEVAAAHVAGALPLADAARIICLRSRLAAQAPRGGAMAVVGLARAQAEALAAAAEGVVVATVNGPTLCALSGSREALVEIIEKVEADGGFARQIKVDYASHSPAMDRPRDELVSLLDGVLTPASPRISWWSTVESAERTTAPEAAYWGDNLRQPVCFWPVLSELIDRGYDTFIEINPHPLLTTSVERGLLAKGRSGVVLPSLHRDQGTLLDFLEPRARLYEAGHSIVPGGLPPENGTIIPLPTYPWRHRRYWTDLSPLQSGGAAAHGGDASDNPDTEEFAEAGDAPSLTPSQAVQVEISRLLGLAPGNLVDPDLSLLAQGFDSLMAMQLVTRLQARHGLELPPGLVSRAATLGINELCEAIESVETAATPTLEVALGAVPLTVGQQWILQVDPHDLHHRNVGLLLRSEQRLEPDLLARAVAAVAARHDIFGLRYTLVDGRLDQQLTADRQLGFAHVDLTSLAPEARDAELARRCAEAHSTLDLAHGPLARVISFHVGGDAPTRLLVTAHHLIVDAFALWTLIIELDQAYAQLLDGGAIALSTPPPPWTTWARQLPSLQPKDLQRWIELASSSLPPLPLDDPSGDNTYASDHEVVVSLDASTTTDLRTTAKTRGVALDTLVLVALAWALEPWLGRPGAFVSRVVHGRSETGETGERMDLSRTPGFFATAHPLTVEGESLEALADATTQALEQVPAQGVGFIALRHSGLEGTAALLDMPMPEVRFNVIGDLAASLEELTRFGLAPEPIGAITSAARQREAELDLWGMIRGDQLEIRLGHSVARLSTARVEALGERLHEALKLLSTDS